MKRLPGLAELLLKLFGQGRQVLHRFHCAYCVVHAQLCRFVLLEELGVDLVVQVPQVHGAVAPTNRLRRLLDEVAVSPELYLVD